MFIYGRKIYSERIGKYASDEDLKQIFKLYKMKYWGLVDNKQWKANNEASQVDSGEIRCKYIVNGTEIFLVRTPDCNHLFFMTAQDIAEHYMEHFFADVENERRRMEQSYREMMGRSRNGRSNLDVQAARSGTGRSNPVVQASARPPRTSSFFI
jgi:hypothetical protein